MAEHRFHTPGPIELDVQLPAGDIDVETVDGEESLVFVEGDERLVDQTEVKFEGNVLSVAFRGKTPFGIAISIGDFSFGNSSKLRIRAQVPHASRAHLSSASADMNLRGRLRSLEAKTASGDLVLSGEVEEDATLKTVSGDVRIDRVGGDLKLTTVSGDANVRSIGGSVEAKTVSGDVRLDSVREGHVTLQSVSGDIAVGVEAGTNLDVDAGSVSGDLSSEVPLGSDAASAAGDGPTLVVRGKSVSGDFRVFRAG
jgi:hypothetical protein